MSAGEALSNAGNANTSSDNTNSNAPSSNSANNDVTPAKPGPGVFVPINLGQPYIVPDATISEREAGRLNRIVVDAMNIAREALQRDGRLPAIHVDLPTVKINVGNYPAGRTNEGLAAQDIARQIVTAVGKAAWATAPPGTLTEAEYAAIAVAPSNATGVGPIRNAIGVRPPSNGGGTLPPNVSGTAPFGPQFPPKNGVGSTPPRNGIGSGLSPTSPPPVATSPSPTSPPPSSSPTSPPPAATSPSPTVSPTSTLPPNVSGVTLPNVTGVVPKVTETPKLEVSPPSTPPIVPPNVTGASVPAPTLPTPTPTPTTTNGVGVAAVTPNGIGITPASPPAAPPKPAIPGELTADEMKAVSG